MRGTAWSLVTMLCCQLLSGWKTVQQTLKVKDSPMREKRRCGMKITTATAEFVARDVKDLKCPRMLEVWRFRVIGSASMCCFQIDLKSGKSCMPGATLGYSPVTVTVASVKDRVVKRKVQIATSVCFWYTSLKCSGCSVVWWEIQKYHTAALKLPFFIKTHLQNLILMSLHSIHLLSKWATMC